MKKRDRPWRVIFFMDQARDNEEALLFFSGTRDFGHQFKDLFILYVEGKNDLRFGGGRKPIFYPDLWTYLVEEH